ncbi:MAG: SCO family protein [Ginsengibacter sp.]
MKPGKILWIFIALVFVLPMMAYALVNWFQSRYEKLPVYNSPRANENLLTQLPSFNFLNQDGRKLNKSDWNNKILVADFFFTHCPSVCPKMTLSLKKVDDYFSKEKILQIASFSVDPERDSCTQLKKYSGQFELNTSQWNLITGSKKDIYKLARNAFKVVATDGDGGPDDFIHSDQIVLIDTKKNIRGYYKGTSPDEIKQLIADIKKLQSEN